MKNHTFMVLALAFVLSVSLFTFCKNEEIIQETVQLNSLDTLAVEECKTKKPKDPDLPNIPSQLNVFFQTAPIVYATAPDDEDDDDDHDGDHRDTHKNHNNHGKKGKHHDHHDSDNPQGCTDRHVPKGFCWSDVDRLNLTVKQIKLGEGRSAISLMDSPQSFDALAYHAENPIQLVNKSIKAGYYKHVRFMVDNTLNTITVNGTDYRLKIPAGVFPGILVEHSYMINGGTQYRITLQMDLQQSELAYNKHHGYILVPKMEGTSQEILPNIPTTIAGIYEVVESSTVIYPIGSAVNITDTQVQIKIPGRPEFLLSFDYHYNNQSGFAMVTNISHTNTSLGNVDIQPGDNVFNIVESNGKLLLADQNDLSFTLQSKPVFETSDGPAVPITITAVINDFLIGNPVLFQLWKVLGEQPAYNAKGVVQDDGTVTVIFNMLQKDLPEVATLFFLDLNVYDLGTIIEADPYTGYNNTIEQPVFTQDSILESDVPLDVIELSTAETTYSMVY